MVATTTSQNNFELVKSLGADVVIDYKTQDFETIVQDYDLVLNSQDTKTLEKSMRVLKKGGKVVSISGPPDIAFAKSIGMSWFMKTVIALMSKKIVKQAKQLNIDYSFLFMQANGTQLEAIAKLIAADIIRPVVDTVFPFEQMNDALIYVASGRAKGKVIVKVR